MEAISSAHRRGIPRPDLAILASNTLGIFTGDWLSDDTGLGFQGAFTLIAAVLALLAVLHYRTAVSATLLFWPAFILTCPLGAAGGDALTKPVSDGGWAGAPRGARPHSGSC